MATTITCPSCNGPLRIPDELVGHRVRCPSCQTILDAGATSSAPAPNPVPSTEPTPASEPERPLWKELQLEVDGDGSPKAEDTPAPKSAPEPLPAPAPARKSNLVGAVELNLSGNDTESSPKPAARAPAPQGSPQRREPPRRPPPAADRRGYPADYDEDHPRGGPAFDRGPRRRDSEPHRGVLVLVLGIVSLVCTIPAFCTYGLFGLVGIPLGVTAWVLGHGDLGKIRRNEMDDEGLGITQAGWICGIIGAALNSLILLSCGGFLTFLLVMEANVAASRPKASFGAPVAPGPPPVVQPPEGQP